MNPTHTETITMRIRRRGGLRLPAAFVLLAALAAAGCATVQRDVLYESAGGQDPLELEAVEAELVRNRAVPGAADLSDLKARLERLARVPSSDAERLARILALRAEAALQGGDRKAAARLLDEARAAYGGDEAAAIVASRLAPDAKARLAALDAAMARSDGNLRLKAELGSALLALGRNREALAAFDAALPFLGDEYELLFGAERDRAWALRDSDAAVAGDAAVYLSTEAITLAGMAVLALSETNALDAITGGEAWDAIVLFDRLKASGFYASSSARPKDEATRADAALFLWRLMSRGDASVLTRYTTRYAARRSSPVPDVAFGSASFDAALGVVEEGIMPLEGGVYFRPDAPATGLDFYGWLLAAAAWR